MNKTVVISAFPACGKTYAFDVLKKRWVLSFRQR